MKDAIIPAAQAAEYQNALCAAVVALRPDLKGWSVNRKHPGFLHLTHPRSGYTVKATPFFDTVRDISVQICDQDGEHVDGFAVPLKYSGDPRKDASAYAAAMKRHWHRIHVVVNRGR